MITKHKIDIRYGVQTIRPEMVARLSESDVAQVRRAAMIRRGERMLRFILNKIIDWTS